MEFRQSSSRHDIVDDTDNDADTEGASAPRVFKKTGPVKHRSRGANRFKVGFSRFAKFQVTKSSQELIRDHARILMKRVGENAAFTGVVLPQEALLVNFDPRQGPCCTVEDFAVEILGKPKSAWNVSATKVFAHDFVAHHPNYHYDTVKKAFSTHFRSLKRAFEQAGLEEAASKARQKEDRRKERKRSV